MRIKVADFVFEIHNKYQYSEKFVCDYLTDEAPDYVIELTDEELKIAQEKALNNSPVHYLEFLEIYRKISDYITGIDGILMHGAVISFDDGAYMFTAPSGTGKTTHIRQWKKLYGDRVGIVNGDKPIIRHIEGEFYAYGTPWCGKEHLNSNTRLPLKGIVLLSRGEKNEIERLPSDSFNKFLFRQIYMPASSPLVAKALEFADKLFTTVPLYSLKCNISTDAARVACEAIT